MTLLTNQAPTIRAEDSFRLVYHGSYAVTTVDKSTNTIGIERIEGPLPKGKFLWDGEDYLGGLEEGQAKLVPFDLVRLFFGDPRSVMGVKGRTESSKGVIGDIPPRENEIRRLSTIYGLYEANAPRLPEAVPDVTITNADDTEIVCVVNDLEGEHVYGFVADSAEVHDVATQLANMRKQIAMLEEQAKAESKNGRNDGADVAHDGPPAKR
jgi:hypothetical protein